MPLLDDFSGFEFEDLMEDVFRNLGYENVHQARKTADEGRDILMEEVVDGIRRGVVVECKHTGSVGRPVVQKLHSAIATYDYDGPKRGIVVTTGQFSAPAEEYATRLRQNGDPYPIELIDGTDLRDIADEVGLDLYNGRIEILCNETLRPFDPASGVYAPVREAARDIQNLDADALPEPHKLVDFQPYLTISARTDAVFETSVGVIHRVNESNRFVVHATRGEPSIADSRLADLIANNGQQAVELDSDRFSTMFDDVDVTRYGQTETDYKEWAVSRLQQHHTTTVSYTGGNNVTYEKTCEPKQSDISIQAISPLYVPGVRQTLQLEQYTYPYSYYAAGPSRVAIEDGIHRCVHCEKETAKSYTYCANCGSINCDSHIKTERLEGTPVCTGCAVTERFVLKTKYFYDEANLEEFRSEYEQMALHEKAMENTPLVGGLLISIVLLLGFTLTSGVV
ncbi:restriction endonuclease [Haloferax sp. Atlit-4N]|uniref:restriction endonuclease n=1 Tax=unclassified Haloferax TaxID=2625095 RepID=UPI000E27C28A|nr:MULTISPECIES: restriction endonuclease [unclassified Haloferax]RDZ39534.1 restriction endonuclease [Haloferax sp. Atlit-19N]RDZ49981.1 restriction endonuclease [Haloferax sp. Atlit-4N]